MTSQRERLEQALGGRIERKDARVIPGTVQVEGTEIIYFSDRKDMPIRKQFKSLTEFAPSPSAQNGGVNDRGCHITLPDGQTFHAIGYHGDLVGWRKDIELGANGLNVLLARIKDGQFVVSDGRAVSLNDCKIEFN